MTESFEHYSNSVVKLKKVFSSRDISPEVGIFRSEEVKISNTPEEAVLQGKVEDLKRNNLNLQDEKNADEIIEKYIDDLLGDYI